MLTIAITCVALVSGKLCFTASNIIVCNDATMVFTTPTCRAMEAAAGCVTNSQTSLCIPPLRN